MINAYLTDTVTKMERIMNSHNEITDWTETSAKARWVRKDKLVEIPGGKQVVSTHQVLMKSTETIDTTYKIKYAGVEYAVIAISQLKDFSARGIEVALK